MLYDITPAISDKTAVFPGDTPPSREVLLDLERGDNITLSTFHSTVHVGAHADGPNHYGLGGRSIDQQPLERYLGPCQVIQVDVPRKSRLKMSDLPVPITESRVLFRTDSHPDPNFFNEDFVGLEPALVDELAKLGVMTIGVDVPSVDVADSKDLPAHAAFFRNDVAIIEGLRLGEVPPGRYELIALPIKLEGFDGAPVRAVLRTI